MMPYLVWVFFGLFLLNSLVLWTEMIGLKPLQIFSKELGAEILDYNTFCYLYYRESLSNFSSPFAVLCPSAL